MEHTVEPQDGTFDFKHIDRVLNAMHRAGIKVIVGIQSTRFEMIKAPIPF